MWTWSAIFRLAAALAALGVIAAMVYSHEPQRECRNTINGNPCGVAVGRPSKGTTKMLRALLTAAVLLASLAPAGSEMYMNPTGGRAPNITGGLDIRADGFLVMRSGNAACFRGPIRVFDPHSGRVIFWLSEGEHYPDGCERDDRR
jgi:hypothetical protein